MWSSFVLGFLGLFLYSNQVQLPPDITDKGTSHINMLGDVYEYQYRLDFETEPFIFNDEWVKVTTTPKYYNNNLLMSLSFKGSIYYDLDDNYLPSEDDYNHWAIDFDSYKLSYIFTEKVDSEFVNYDNGLIEEDFSSSFEIPTFFDYSYTDYFSLDYWCEEYGTYRIEYDVYLNDIDFYYNIFDVTYSTTGNKIFSTFVENEPIEISSSLSDFIYNFSISKSAYTSGYSNGYDFGYSQGQYYGYNDGYAKGLSTGSNSSYSNGYNDGVNVGYEQGKDYGYNNGYSEGYNNGFNEGVSIDQTAFTIFNGILNISMVPVNFFLSIFNFEILGINLKSLVSALLTLSLIIVIIRLITGKKE